MRGNSGTLHICLCRTWCHLLRKFTKRAALLGQPAGASCSGQSSQRHQKTTIQAPPAWDKPATQAVWPCASVSSALAAFSSGPWQAQCAYSVGDLLILSYRCCQQMTRRKSTVGFPACCQRKVVREMPRSRPPRWCYILVRSAMTHGILAGRRRPVGSD